MSSSSRARRRRKARQKRALLEGLSHGLQKKKRYAITVADREGDAGLEALTDEVSVDIERDYMDATHFGSLSREYLMGGRTLVIKAKLDG